MKKAFQLCDSCNFQPSCPTGVALDASECGKEIEIRTCKAYEPYKWDATTIIPADESNMDSFIRIFEEDDEEDGMDSFIRILKD